MNEIEYLKDTLRKLTGFDAEHYKERPFKRRVRVRMRARKVESFKEYAELLMRDREEIRKLLDTLTINVSRFFRNKETFDFIEKHIFPFFPDGLRIWSAGCATGEEPYSLAILLMENRKEKNSKILASDIDENALKKAQEGIYPLLSFTETPDYIKNTYFMEIEDGKWEIKESVKELVEFHCFDLAKIPGDFRDFDIIMCRNVLIYLSREFQENLIREFHRRLKDGGFLILGKVEMLVGDTRDLFYALEPKERVYRKL
ncbi:protein-glutamate O-methyltransferase CheR [bacterium]|nr:MAG: protein-glutamate O-methyltransferase CheR [bacterium]